MKLQQIYESSINTLVKTDIKNIRKEWDVWWKQNKNDFSVDKFLRFWKAAGYAKSAYVVLNKLHDDGVIDLSFEIESPTEDDESQWEYSAIEYFEKPSNVNKFVKRVVQTAAKANPRLFRDRLEKLQAHEREDNDRSWWEVIGYKPENNNKAPNRDRSRPQSSNYKMDDEKVESALEKLLKDRESLKLDKWEIEELNRLYHQLKRSR